MGKEVLIMANYIIGTVVFLVVVYALYRVIKNAVSGKSCIDSGSSCSGCSVSKSCHIKEKE